MRGWSIYDSRAVSYGYSRRKDESMSGAQPTSLHSAVWRPPSPLHRRAVRTAHGLRVFALLVGVAVITSRSGRR